MIEVGIEDVKDALNSFGGDELSVDDRSVKEGSNGDAGQGPINVQCHNMPSKRFAVFPVRQTSASLKLFCAAPFLVRVPQKEWAQRSVFSNTR